MNDLEQMSSPMPSKFQQIVGDAKEDPAKALFYVAVVVAVLAALASGFRALQSSAYFSGDGAMCIYNGEEYSNKQIFSAGDTCNTCTCNQGSIQCTEISCDGEDDTYLGRRDFDLTNSYYSEDLGLEINYPDYVDLTDNFNSGIDYLYNSVNINTKPSSEGTILNLVTFAKLTPEQTQTEPGGVGGEVTEDLPTIKFEGKTLNKPSKTIYGEGGPCKDEFGNMGSGVSKQSSFYYNLYDDVYAIIHVSIVNCSTDNLYANFDLEKAIQEEIDNGEDFALAVAIIENAQRKENSADQVVSFSTNNNQYASNVDLTLTVPSQYIVSKYKETSESDLFRLGTDVVDVTYNGSTLSFYFISEALPTPFSNLVNLGYHKSFGQLYSAIPEAQLPTDNTIEYSDSSITDCYSGQGDECLIFSVGVDSRDSTFFSASCTSPTNDFTDCDNMIKGITFE